MIVLLFSLHIEQGTRVMVRSHLTTPFNKFVNWQISSPHVDGPTNHLYIVAGIQAPGNYTVN
jgi:hypothetical protein